MAYQYIYGSDTMEAATRKINENFLDVPTSESITAEAVAEAKEYTDSVVSNPNLLINGDFQVWQRGTSFTGNKYAADRWYIGNNTVSAEQLSPKGIHMTSTSTTGAWWLRYYFEPEYLDHLRGNTVTFSVKIKKSRNFSCYLRAYIYQNQTDVISLGPVTTEWQILSGTITIDEDTTLNAAPSFGFVTDGGLNGSDYLDIEYVKLEAGSVATPLSPRPYAEELAMCQRYFLPITNPDSSNGTLGIGAYNSNGYVVLNMPIITSMRTKPTLSGAYTGNRLRLYYAPTAYEQVSNAEVLDYSAAFVTLALTPGGSGIPTNENRAINVVYVSNGHFYLDAEIYP